MEVKDKAAVTQSQNKTIERKTTMSSTTPIQDKGLFSTFLAINHSLSDDGSVDKPEEKPEEKPEQAAEAKMQRGFTPSRASWHTVRGKIMSRIS